MHIVPKNSLLAPSGAEKLGRRAESAPLATHNNQGVGMERVYKILLRSLIKNEMSVAKIPWKLVMAKKHLVH